MPVDPVSVQEAIDHLYRTAVTGQATTSTRRLEKLAAYAVCELDVRGLTGAETEVTLPGGGRPKHWDVAWKHDAKYRLGISLKSILANLSGTVPNRIDDMMGEVTNVQMFSPEIVVGYLMVFDTSKDTAATRQGISWCEILRSRLSGLTGRSAPAWSIGTVEASLVMEVDFSAGPRLLTSGAELGGFFDLLAAEVRRRNPGVGQP